MFHELIGQREESTDRQLARRKEFVAKQHMDLRAAHGEGHGQQTVDDAPEGKADGSRSGHGVLPVPLPPRFSTAETLFPRWSPNRDRQLSTSGIPP